MLESTPPPTRTADDAQVPTVADPTQQAKMVGWYDPGQLARTGIEVIVSTIFGRYADHRLMEAMADGSDEIFDYTCDERSSPRQEIWIDYVADTGDGWNSTYTVAYYLAQPKLSIKDSHEKLHDLKRGQILIFGGDEVYPTASRKEYTRRLVWPYETTLKCTNPPHPRVFAIPGNHDWYDSLVSFTRIFISKQWFAGWQAPQSRSYFAVKLPHNWWLLGTDVQLGSDIDGPQVQYFQKVAKQMRDGDRVILCNAEPHWIYAALYRDYDPSVYNESNLKFLEEKVLQDHNVRVFLAGDLHHYRRHAAPDGTQKITAGGGGAFLHPTHGPDVSTLEDKERKVTYALKASFPDEKTSKRLCWRNLLFPFLNKWFGIVPAVLYLLTSWVVMSSIGHFGISQMGLALWTAFQDSLIKPAAVFWVLALFFGVLFFTDTHSQRYRIIGGSVHALTHLLAVFLIGWGATYLTVHTWGLPFQQPSQLLPAAVGILLGGYVVGSFIMGVYLLVSLNCFCHHQNEAFSSLAIEDWKHFLRLKIDEKGDLTIFPIGIRRVARNWKRRDSATSGPALEPDPNDDQATLPELIEPPIVVKP